MYRNWECPNCKEVYRCKEPENCHKCLKALRCLNPPKKRRATPEELKERFAAARDREAKALFSLSESEKATCNHPQHIYLWDHNLRCEKCYRADKRKLERRKIRRKKLRAAPVLYHYRYGRLVKIGPKSPYDVPTPQTARMSEQWDAGSLGVQRKTKPPVNIRE